MSKVVMNLNDIKGIERAITVKEAYADPEKTGDTVVIIGGGIAGAELGAYLGRLGRTVTFVEKNRRLSGSPEKVREAEYNMVSSGIDARCNTQVFEITDRGVDCSSGFLEADTVVYAE
ncbi:MAG: FAD-dependent oxidoreductase [Papillibacter sp.]|jgi:NADPH-dependent 2,4-dienoyl-CoA reductase/sulfur reductase-like enzyme|nr:FAD-dependent oxidoreductase [Papillibacter sp.]